MSKKFIQDAGHGGTDNGCTGYGRKVYEKEWTIEAAHYVDKRLGELGVWSKMTRTSDKTLDSGPRTNLVKKSGADVCLSHHFNAFNGEAEGIETIHSIYSDGKLARKIADELKKASGFRIRRVFDRKGKSGDYYYMHRLTGSVETIIIEYNFLDNKEAYEKLKSKAFREKCYEAVVKAACDYAGAKYKAPKEDKPKKKTMSPGHKPLYKVQAGAFDDKKSAEEQAEKLKKAGFDTYVFKE